MPDAGSPREMGHEDRSDEGSDPPRRTAESVGSVLVITGVLLVQIGLASAYYIESDRFDERFAWRMFSSIRLTECRASALEYRDAGRPRRLDLRRRIQMAWVSLLKRNRTPVVEAYLRRRCADSGVGRASVRTLCSHPDGRRTRHRWTRNCEAETIDYNEARVDQ